MIWLLPIVSLVVGFVEQGHGNLLTIQATLSIALIFFWVLKDARKRKYQTSWMLKLALISLTVFSLPYYLLKSRGWKGGGKAMAWAALLFVGTMLCYRIGATV